MTQGPPPGAPHTSRITEIYHMQIRVIMVCKRLDRGRDRQWTSRALLVGQWPRTAPENGGLL